MLKYFTGSIAVSIVGLILSYFLGVFYLGSPQGGLQFLFLASVLSLLEISISFDNAVVNATVLKSMTPVWQRRFLTWGIAIAVFGMRLVFPLLIVAVMAHLSPWNALVMAATQPDEYAKIMLSIHHEVSAFGGTFLLLVSLKYFFDIHKQDHWFVALEKFLVKIGRLEAIEIGLALAVLYFFSTLVPQEEKLGLVYAGIAGIIIFLLVEGLGTFLKSPDEQGITDIHKASVGMFIYLEVLDASFSFDGVVGAFAITNNLFLIAIGLGIGAMFVRSLTVMMVERGTLEAFRYLEHGAFYAVGALALIMFTNTVIWVPELLTGCVGVALIGFSIYSSIKVKRLVS